MKNIRRINLRSGVTLIEMLISISLSSIVFIVAGTLMALYVTHNTRSVRQERFEQTRNDLVTELSDRIRWSKQIEILENCLKVDDIEYCVVDEIFTKDGLSLLSEQIAVKKFQVVDYSASLDIRSLEITIEMFDKSYPLSADVLRLVVSQRRTEVVEAHD